MEANFQCEIYRGVVFYILWDMYDKLVVNYTNNINRFIEHNEKKNDIKIEINQTYFLSYDKLAELIYNEFEGVLKEEDRVLIDEEFFDKYFDNARISVAVNVKNKIISVSPKLEYDEIYRDRLKHDLSGD